VGYGRRPHCSGFGEALSADVPSPAARLLAGVSSSCPLIAVTPWAADALRGPCPAEDPQSHNPAVRWTCMQTCLVPRGLFLPIRIGR
jgi:hypothetical protein